MPHGETLNSQERGAAIISLLRSPANLRGKIYQNHGTPIRVTNETAEVSDWTAFVAFPPELSRTFPDSFIDPHVFLRELGYRNREGEVPLGSLLSADTGTYDYPTFHHSENSFNLDILHGLANRHALAMTRLAKIGFGDPAVRAAYQEEMFATIEPALSNPAVSSYAVRIHDDCLASGDSIAGYLMRRLAANPHGLDEGVEVVIDGPATAQGILFLKAFAKEHGFPVHITAGYMAFGLSRGEEVNHVRKHANYITYPPELMKYLRAETRSVLDRYREEGKDLQVVGDMGEAEKGIDGEIMLQIRSQLHNNKYCVWNDDREDPHGDHPKKQEVMPRPEKKGDHREDVYFARGGYLPYSFDRLAYGGFSGTNKVIERASRLWTEEYGYGAGFRSA